MVLVSAASSAAGDFQAVGELTPDSTFEGAKSKSGGLAQTDPSLLGRTDSSPINVMIKYDYDATASYTGGVAGLAPTSPSVTHKKLKDNKGAVDAYNAYAADVSDEVSSAIENAVPAATIGTSFTTVYGGVAAEVPANSIDDLLKVDGVAAVQKDTLQHPLTDTTPAFIGATSVWPSVGGPTNAASNVIVGVIDTGIWPEHASFADNLPPLGGGPFACQFGDGTDVANLGPTFSCNDKLIGAYAFTTTYMNNVGAGANEFCNAVTKVCSARDPVGHGTHTSSTAAGDGLANASLFGVNRGPISGIAPGARLIMYRVCLAAGCFNSDSVAAVQRSILDGADVLNYSISGGASPYTDPVELAFLDAFNAGISVNASAGNTGPGAATVNHGGPWVTTVGASTSNRFFTSTLHLTADGGATFDMEGVTITTGIASATPVVLAQTIPGEDALCQSVLAPGAAAGKIVACQRGVNARVDKGFNVAQGGAAGMILYNAVKQDVETDNHWLPAIHVDGPSTALLAFINGHTNVTATWAQGTKSATQPDVMAAFSSRGPSADFIKPDITAPGIQVLAGMTPQPTGITNGPPGQFFQAIAGTSMSSPHAAGASALVKAAHPTWTPAQIKSALMTASVQTVVKEDGVTPANPFDMGAGSLRVNRSVNPTLVFDETHADFLASAGNPLSRIDLNLPSVDAPTMTGTITTTRTATNVTGQNQVLNVSTTAPAGASITVGANNGNINVKAGETITFPITISGPSLANGQYFGRITLDPQKPGANPVTIPVAFVKKQGAVTMTHSCSPTTFPVSSETDCTVSLANLASVPANVSLEVKGSPGLHYNDVSPPATLIPPHFGLTWSGTLGPSLPPTVDSITAVVNDPSSYLPLSGFGVPPIAGVGDDTITNFNVPTFFYGGEPYTRLGVGSNGTLVVGGGTSADATPFPQTFPNTARPNNTIAPLWTDLNPPAGGAIRIATLTDGVDTWIVVDWAAVKNFGDATTHSFEVWLKIGAAPASEQITLVYGVANTAAPDLGTGGNSGAENRDGTSGKNLATPADSTEWRVNLSPPTAGGTQVITYDADADSPGSYSSTASMTSNVTPGTTQVVQNLTVTP